MPFLISRPVNAAPVNCEPLVGGEDLRLAVLVSHVRCLRCLVQSSRADIGVKLNDGIEAEIDILWYTPASNEGA